jgi:hypothetical protein
LLHDDTWPKIPVLANDLDEFRVGFLARAIRVDKDRQGLSDTNSIGKLDKDTTSEACSDNGLG